MNLNVFSGKNALKDFYDPDKAPPVALVELPSHPFESDGVEIYAKMLNLLPAANVKSLPALNMLLRAVESGQINEDTKRIIEWSSGNTAISLAIISRIYGLANVSAYISNKNPEAKMQLLRFFVSIAPVTHSAVHVSLGTGNAPRSSVAQLKLIQMTSTAEYVLPLSMEDKRTATIHHNISAAAFQNPEAHIRWTGPQLHKQLPDMSVFAAGLGTAGTITGVGTYLKSVNPGIVNIGVFTAPNDKVPGPRPIDLAPPPADMDLPWKDVIDEAEFATSLDSYQASLELCRQGLLVGPSSGLALTGLYHFLEKTKASGGLDRLRGRDGKIKCAFICCDQPFQYIGEYFDKLPPNLFPKIVNEELLGVDQYPYGSSWTISPEEAYNKINALAAVLDLRDSDDFDNVRISGSINLDLRCKEESNPFRSPPILRRQWLELEGNLHAGDSKFGPKLFGKIVIVNSYNGHTAVIASSVLRKKGVEAYAVRDGFDFATGDLKCILEYGKRSPKYMIQVSRIDFESGKTNVFEYAKPERCGIQ
ncbi:Cysteine synthase B [Mycena sanguinolenta]|uniref:Cysteine synthase B n=1 Tax=Mycena sanguinolenta TaxID=230812 RepID=A0A8H6ZH18_9AGAR|nr:Cysteine synthase B [Mycena sanguinolenta]